MHRFLLEATAAAWVLGAWSCSTQVDVGKNDRIPRRTPSPETPSGQGEDSRVDPRTGERPDSGPGDTPPLPGPGHGDPAGGCFDAVPSLSGTAKEFCESLKSPYKETFSKVANPLCEQKLYANLFANGCSWTGEGDPMAYHRIAFRTPDDASGREYTYFSVSSQEVDLSVDDALSRTLLMYEDPAAFKARFKTPASTKVLDSVKQDDHTYDFTVESSNAVALTKFRARLEVLSLESGARILAARDLELFKTMKEFRHLTFLVPAGDDGRRTRIVTLSRKWVDDMGLHAVAFHTLLDLDRETMELVDENARRP